MIKSKIHILLRLCVFLPALVFQFACKDYSTSDLLTLKFPTGGTKGLKVTSPSPVTVGQPFTVTVTATNSAMPNGIQQDYQNKINLTLQVGGGTLTSVTGGGWYLGTQSFTVVYNNPSLSLNSTEVILLNGSDPLDSGRNAVSNNITATSQVVFNQFKVVVPGVVFKDQAFTATITASNSDNTTNTAYNGTVNLSTYLVAGTVTPATATGFVNGVVTVSLTLNQSYTNLQLKAADSVTSSLSGLSNTFQVYYDTVALTVFPQSSTNMRLEWTYPTGTNTALIYRDSGSGMQLISTQFSPTSYYADLGLNTGQSYPYQVIVRNAGATISYSASKTATPAACVTTEAGGAITSGPTWSAAGSPYCIKGNVTIGGTLTINPGVAVVVDPGFSFTVASGGTLITLGTATDPVVFTSSNVAPVAADWKGIIFASGAVGSVIASDNYASGSKITNTRISFAGPGITTSESLYLDGAIVQNNASTASPGGGGISANIASGKQLVIKNSLVLNNALSGNALGGGGIYCSQRAGIYSSKIMNNSNTSNNNGGYGAGVYIGGNGSTMQSNQVSLNNQIYVFNNASAAGAGAYFAGNNHTIVGNTFRANTFVNGFGSSGGALYLSGSGSTISNNIFDTNAAAGGSASVGGAVVMSGTLNLFTRNTVINNSSNGNATNIAGGVSSGGNTITYNEISGGVTTGCGGGLALSSGTTVNYNNIYSNTASSCNGKSVYVTGVGVYDLTNNYWGGAVSGLTTMGICDSTNGCSGTATITGAVSTAYPLCKTAPSDPNCVGANF